MANWTNRKTHGTAQPPPVSLAFNYLPSIQFPSLFFLFSFWYRAAREQPRRLFAGRTIASVNTNSVQGARISVRFTGNIHFFGVFRYLLGSKQALERTVTLFRQELTTTWTLILSSAH